MTISANVMASSKCHPSDFDYRPTPAVGHDPQRTAMASATADELWGKDRPRPRLAKTDDVLVERKGNPFRRPDAKNW